MFESYALPFAFGAGLFTAIANLCMRRSIDVGGNTNGYLLMQLLISGMLATWMHPIQNHAYELDGATAALGLSAGICLAAVMIFMGRSLARGPSGLSVAFINSSTVVPAAIMFFIFGHTYGFSFEIKHIVGCFLVVVGLFWASTTTLQVKNLFPWARAITIVFIAHVALLLLMQYRALLLKSQLPLDPTLLPFHIQESTSHWFLPIMFAVAWLIQFKVFMKAGSKGLSFKELGYGTLGGLANGLSAILLVQSATRALPHELTLNFPLYSVSIVLVCSLWSLALYKERVNWPAILLSASGILLGSS